MNTKSPKNIVSRPQSNSKPQPSRPAPQPSRSQIHQRQLRKAVQERRRLKAAEHSAPKKVKKQLKSRGELVGRRIADLQSKTKNQ